MPLLLLQPLVQQPPVVPSSCSSSAAFAPAGPELCGEGLACALVLGLAARPWWSGAAVAVATAERAAVEEDGPLIPVSPQLLLPVLVVSLRPPMSMPPTPLGLVRCSACVARDVALRLDWLPDGHVWWEDHPPWQWRLSRLVEVLLLVRRQRQPHGCVCVGKEESQWTTAWL